MSLQFVMGPSGSGKSHYLYEWVTRESLEHSDRNYIVLVPEQFTMQTQKDLVTANPHGGILNVEVLSFHRLAQRVFEEVGETQRVILDEVGKNFIIRKIAGDNEEKLKVLGNKLKKIGYISEIKSVISEFTQYDIQPDMLDELQKKAEKNPILCQKLSDIKTIYEGFREYLKEKYITGEEILDVLSLVAKKSKLLKDSVIVLDGFTGFTPVQNKLLRELLHVCDKLVITVTMDPDENPFVYKHPYQLFALSKQMVTTLMQIARECGATIEEPVCLYQKPVYRFRENEPLSFLESHLFRYSGECYAKEQEVIQVWRAKNPQEEADFVAQRIRHLVRTKHYRYRDFAVLTNDIDAYATHMERAFSRYEIPVFMDHKRTILLNSCVEYIRSLLAMAEQNFTYESVFRYLRTGLVNFKREEIDVLENYVVALGIRGYKKWQEKWVRRTQYMDEAELAEINRIREAFVGSIEAVMTVLKNRSKTVFGITEALHTFFMKEELQKRVKEYQLKFERQGELALEKEYAQVYRIVIELLDRFVELLGEEKISLKEYCELMDAGLEEAKVGIIPPSIDQVVVGDVERSRIKDVKVVFLLGANDVYIPGVAQNAGLLSEYDRQLLSDSGATLAPGTKEKTYIQKFYLYLILTKPTNQVYLTYSKSSADGKSMRPSYLVADLKKLFTKLQVQDVSLLIQDRELTVESGIDCLVGGLQHKEKGLSKGWQELYTWYKRQPEWEKKVEQIVEAAFYEKPASILSRETAKKLYGDILENSVTRLENFSKCAYSHFLAYGLKLKEREEYRFRALDLGNLFHGSLEKYSKKLDQAGFTWTDVTEDAREALIHESVEECIVDYGNSILYSTARNEYIIQRLKRMLRRTVWALSRQLEKGDFGPEGYEISFGKFSGLETSDIDLGDLGRMNLRGKIDRVDICEEEDKVYVKVIDYKTGRQVFDLGELCYGIQMQLVIYMNAAMEMQKRKNPKKQIIPAGLFYYRMQDPIVSKPKGEKSAEEMILKELCPDGVVQGSEDVLTHLDREFLTSSDVIPVSKTKSGELSKTSKVLSEADFRLISDFAKEQVRKIGTKIMEGEAEIAPYELDGVTGCQYCPYQSVCRFEEQIPGFTYRKLEKLDRERALEKMREEVPACQ